jgi:Protein of unknown function (DUF3800)
VNYGTLETLFAALCLGRRKLFILVRGFGSYCDEFGHPKDLTNKKFMGLAGLLAWSDDWIALTQRWREIQNSEKVPTFHMTDFIHHTENFSDKRWESGDERKRILSLFLDATKSAKVIPVSAAISLRDFYGLTMEQQKQLVSPYHVVFQQVTFDIGFAVVNKALQTAEQAEDFVQNRVAMVYGKLKKYTGPAEELWNAVKEHNLTGQWMSSFTPGDPADYPPLQAADIWAYSLGHMHEHHPPNKIEAVTSFEFFVDATFSSQGLGHSFFTFFDRNKLLTCLGEMPEMEK